MPVGRLFPAVVFPDKLDMKVNFNATVPARVGRKQL